MTIDVQCICKLSKYNVNKSHTVTKVKLNNQLNLISVAVYRSLFTPRHVQLNGSILVVIN